MIWALLIISTFASVASTVNIEVRGIVSEAACELKSRDYFIDFKKVYFPISNAQQVSGWEPFSIELINCPSYIKNVKLIFNGTPDTTNPDYFLNTGSSKSTALELHDVENNMSITNGRIITKSVNPNTRSAIYPLSARVVGYGGIVNTGSFQSRVMFSINYN
ncbi:fimbrial protein [Providencia sp. PROV257]|uniref:fimbrial protein n=1 Tax=Providencia sp. PROV257 TaxID=2949945 RepID=UPI00234BFA20|nr:fimbrial protein [Providencia sp. PROV257]